MSVRINRSTGRGSAPVPLSPPQIPHDGPGSNPGHGGKPATNSLSYCTANIAVVKIPYRLSYGMSSAVRSDIDSSSMEVCVSQFNEYFHSQFVIANNETDGLRNCNLYILY
jgi:hypothetical protein